MKIFPVIFLFLFCITAEAQKALTVEEAVNLSLKNNFDILVSRNDANIARVNNTAGNAGMLPSVALAASGDYGINDVHQKLTGGTENNYTSSTTSFVSAGAELSWTLYDGGRMFITKNKLNEVEALGEIQFKDKVLQTLYSTIAAYYDVVRQKQQLNSINETLNYNRERVNITQAVYTAGTMLKSDWLMAKIDLNVSMQNAIQQKFSINAALKTLNLLMGQNFDTTYEISDSIPLNYSPVREVLMNKLSISNTNILTFKKQMEITQLALKETRTSYLPSVNFNAGYYLSQTTNSHGSVLNNFSVGPQIGGSLVVPLYSAGENKRKVAAAKIQLLSAEYELQNIKLQVNTIFENTLTEFENQQQLLKIEKENIELAKENLKISLERLRLGQTTSLEVRLAQQDFVISSTRLINFQYNLKMAETKLKKLVSAF